MTLEHLEAHLRTHGLYVRCCTWLEPDLFGPGRYFVSIGNDDGVGKGISPSLVEAIAKALASYSEFPRLVGRGNTNRGSTLSDFDDLLEGL